MDPASNARRNWCLQQGHIVAKNSTWEAVCPKHGKQPHLSYLGGRCQKCHEEGLEAKGLLAPERRR